MTNNQFIKLKRGQVVRYNAYNIFAMVIYSDVDRDVIHEVRMVLENGTINTYRKEQSHDFSLVDPDSLT